MTVLSRTADLAYTYRFISLLVSPWEKTEAFKHGLIDDKGKRTGKKAQTGEEKSSYTFFHRLVFNIKRLLANAPGGKTRLASFAAALFLLKEDFDVDVDKVLMELNIPKTEKKKIKKMVDDKSKELQTEDEGATTTADIAQNPVPLKFKSFVRRKKPDEE